MSPSMEQSPISTRHRLSQTSNRRCTGVNLTGTLLSHIRFGNRFPCPVVLLLLSVCLFSPGVQGSDGELCVVETSMKSPYFIPFVTVPSVCLGCSFPKSTAKSTAFPVQEGREVSLSSVHLLRIGNSKDRLLELSLESYSNFDLVSSEDGGFGVAILLAPEEFDSPPLSYVIYAEQTLSNISLIIMARTIDTIDLTGMPEDYHVIIKALNASTSTAEGAKESLGFVSSVTKIGVANRVSISIDEDASGSGIEDCGDEPPFQSPVAKCSTAIKKQTAGCYHEHMIGASKRDIHIIEIDWTDNSTFNKSIFLRVKGENFPSVEESHLKPEDGARSLTKSASIAVKRNLTLVLKTNQPTTWAFKVTNLDGFVTVYVGDGDQVENKSSSSGERGQSSTTSSTVSVKRRQVPDSFDQMILHVLTSIGAPISYTRTRAPDVISVVVPSSPYTVGGTVPKSTISNEHEKTEPELEDEASSLINNYVTKECREHHVTVALPIWVAELVGGVHMTFRDPECKGFKNETHFMLMSQYSECGFVQEVNGEVNIYTNFANVQIVKSKRHHRMPLGNGISDDEDFEGSGFGSEDLYREKIPTIVVTCKKIPKHLRPITELPSLEPSIGYNLEAFQDDRFIYSYRMFPARLSEDGKLFARISFSNIGGGIPKQLLQDLDLKLLVEQCWLSSSKKANDADEVPFTLITKSCAIEKSVMIQRDYFSDDFKFAFQLTPRFSNFDNIYLHCQVGVCYQDSLPKPSMKRCVDPESYCSKRSLINIFTNHVVASYVENLVVGPFIPNFSQEAISNMNFNTESRMAPNLGPNNHPNGDEGKQFSKNGVLENTSSFPAKRKKSHIIVMEGLSTEIVVGIALASFVIGVCLTATMWIIYMKTDPRRQKRQESHVPTRNSGYDLSAHSGSSTPSSQAPMTA